MGIENACRVLIASKLFVSERVLSVIHGLFIQLLVNNSNLYVLTLVW